MDNGTSGALVGSGVELLKRKVILVIERIKKYWHDPVWSKVIAGSILALAAGIGTYLFDWWPAIKQFLVASFNFLSTQTEISNWLIGVLVFPWLLILIAIVFAQVTQRRNPPAPSWRNYTSDIFFGIKWAWRYDETGQVFGLYSLCPNCDYQIYPKTYDGWKSDEIHFHCENCNNNLGHHNDEVAQFENKVLRHIQRKLRTCEWLTSP